jgi:hypothetical protein
MRSFVRAVPELFVLIFLTLAAYVTIGIFSKVSGTAVLTPTDMWLIVFGSFLFSTLIAIVAVVAGIGGGVLFTPVMLAFSSIDTVLIRATGLVVAMFSGLISTGPFMRRGLSEVKVVFFCSVPIVVGGTAGALSAIHLAKVMGATGDAIVRLLLGTILVFIALMFVVGGSKTEYPEPKKYDDISKKLGLYTSYWEESLQKVVHFQAVRAPIGFLLFFAVGFTGGFFGLGGGWAVVPVLNLVMAVPLKVSAACSGVLLAMGNAAAIWPYILCGSLIAVLAVPWMLGQVIGGILGAHILVKIKAGFVRKILIVILFLTSFKLIARGVETLFGIDIPIF